MRCYALLAPARSLRWLDALSWELRDLVSLGGPGSSALAVLGMPTAQGPRLPKSRSSQGNASNLFLENGCILEIWDENK